MQTTCPRSQFLYYCLCFVLLLCLSQPFPLSSPRSLKAAVASNATFSLWAKRIKKKNLHNTLFFRQRYKMWPSKQFEQFTGEEALNRWIGSNAAVCKVKSEVWKRNAELFHWGPRWDLNKNVEEVQHDTANTTVQTTCSIRRSALNHDNVCCNSVWHAAGRGCSTHVNGSAEWESLREFRRLWRCSRRCPWPHLRCCEWPLHAGEAINSKWNPWTWADWIILVAF